MTEITKIYVPNERVSLKTPVRVNFTRIEDADGMILCGHSLESRPGSMEELCLRANAYKELPSVEDLEKLAEHYRKGPDSSEAAQDVADLLDTAIEAMKECDHAFRRRVNGSRG